MLNISCSERQAINDCNANDHGSNERIKHRAQGLKTNYESRRQYVNERFVTVHISSAYRNDRQNKIATSNEKWLKNCTSFLVALGT